MSRSLVSLLILILLAVIGIGYWLLRPPSLPNVVRKPWEMVELIKDTDPAKISTNPSGSRLLAEAGKPDVKHFPLTTDPSSWRKLDRGQRFEWVVLLGPVAEFNQLLQHLKDAPDWNLELIDGWGFAFRRGPKRDLDIPDPDSIGLDWNPDERGEWLARYAAHLAAIGRYQEAAAYTSAARKADDDSAMPWAVDAIVHFHQERFQDALMAAEKALHIDRDLLLARQMKVHCLLQLEKFEQAYHAAENLVETSADFYSLTLGARVAHAVHAYQVETAWLERAISLAEKHGGSTAGLQILLGQAYAKQGFAPQSIKAFETALSSGELSEDQVKEVQAVLHTVRGSAPSTP